MPTVRRHILTAPALLALALAGCGSVAELANKLDPMPDAASDAVSSDAEKAGAESAKVETVSKAPAEAKAPDAVALEGDEATDPSEEINAVAALPRPAPMEVAFGTPITETLAPDLIAARAITSGGAGPLEARAQALCAAAETARAAGRPYLRHLRTNLAKDSGLWSADAVYTISPTPPAGMLAMQANNLLATCAKKQIPTG